jgi:hypothetical protein
VDTGKNADILVHLLQGNQPRRSNFLLANPSTSPFSPKCVLSDRHTRRLIARYRDVTYTRGIFKIPPPPSTWRIRLRLNRLDRISDVRRGSFSLSLLKQTSHVKHDNSSQCHLSDPDRLLSAILPKLMLSLSCLYYYVAWAVQLLPETRGADNPPNPSDLDTSVNLFLIRCGLFPISVPRAAYKFGFVRRCTANLS